MTDDEIKRIRENNKRVVEESKANFERAVRRMEIAQRNIKNSC